MKVALLVSSNMVPGADDAREDIHEYHEEMGALTPALQAHGMSLEPLLWDTADRHADDYAAMLPLMVWDYFEGNEARFLDVMARVSARTALFNPVETLRWNSDKSYLEELAERGAPTIPTMRVDRVTQADAQAAFELFGTDRIVIKPQVGGGAWRQALHAGGEPWPDADKLPPAEALIQPFLPSVQSEGEYTFLYFGGRFSHACVKNAVPGDYRIQSIYGGTETTYRPSADELSVAQAVIDTLDEVPLYARVDLLRGLDGKLALIEIEMIEPYLYLSHAEVRDGLNQGAVMFAEALRARL